MKKQSFIVTGMHCAVCAKSVEDGVNQLPGVEDTRVNLLEKTMYCTFDESLISLSKIQEAVEKAGFHAEKKDAASFSQENQELNQLKKRLPRSLFLLVLLMGLMGISSWSPGWIDPMILGILQMGITGIIVFINRVFFSSGIKALLEAKPNMDSLVAIGAGSAILYSLLALLWPGNHYSHLYFDSAGMILTLITLGKFLEERAKGKTTNAVARLMDLSVKEARVFRDEKWTIIPVEDILVGDRIQVKPGDAIPVDGVVLEGSSVVDASSVTGESLPIEKESGDKVISSTLNISGQLVIGARKVGNETTLAKMIQLVAEATGSKSPSTKLADRVANIFVPTVMGISLVTFLVWFLLGGQTIAFSLSLAIAVLVISCPCALGLATPVAIMVAMGKLAQEGILVKSAQALESLAQVDRVIMDKTGTLTRGTPQVTSVVVFGMNEKELMTIALGLEQYSEHPLAKAIVEYGKEIPPQRMHSFSACSGKGVSASYNGRNYFAGSLSYMKELGFSVEEIQLTYGEKMNQGETPVVFADEKAILGLIFLKDQSKEGAGDAVKKIKKLGALPVMVTGDRKGVARFMAKKLEIEEMVAEALPQDKSQEIIRYQKDGHRVAMVGDGINDSPALAQADVGIVMGDGTDIAMDSGNVVLTSGDLKKVPRSMAFSKKTKQIIKQNLFWAFFYNVLAIPLAAGAFYPLWGFRLSPVIAAACMSISSIIVTTNALRLYKK